MCDLNLRPECPAWRESVLRLVSLSTSLDATRSSRVTAGFIKGAGGISPVDCPGVENVNLSNLISGHFDYAVKMPEIVELLHL